MHDQRSNISVVRTHLSTLIACVLDATASYGERFQAAHDLESLCSSLTGLQDKSIPADNRPHWTLGGKALSPREAARCLWDFMRTACFMQAVLDAIAEAQRRFPGERIEILYAGSGPFAALVLPSLLHYPPEQVHVTILDIHQESVDSVVCLLDVLGLQAAVGGVVLTDATIYQPPPDQAFHVLVIETMQRALQNEPQVAMTLNLVPHLIPNGILVPERVVVRACLVDQRREFALTPESPPERLRIELGPVVDLSLDIFTPAHSAAAARATLTAPKHLVIPESRPASTTSLMLCTHITTFGSLHLDEYMSALTYPALVVELDGGASGMLASCAYVLGERPGVHIDMSGP